MDDGPDSCTDLVVLKNFTSVGSAGKWWEQHVLMAGKDRWSSGWWVL
jgi:hypothetical protein